jgi:hypothetical protein
MGVLEEQAQLGLSLGQEAHRLDAMAHTLGQHKRLIFPLGQRKRPWRISPSPCNPNDFPLEAKMSLWRA